MLPQIAEVLARIDGKDYVVQSGTVEQAVAAGLHRRGPGPRGPLSDD